MKLQLWSLTVEIMHAYTKRNNYCTCNRMLIIIIRSVSYSVQFLFLWSCLLASYVVPAEKLYWFPWNIMYTCRNRFSDVRIIFADWKYLDCLVWRLAIFLRGLCRSQWYQKCEGDVRTFHLHICCSTNVHEEYARTSCQENLSSSKCYKKLSETPHRTKIVGYYKRLIKVCNVYLKQFSSCHSIIIVLNWASDLTCG
jgi:hypothetical protein